MQWRLDQTNKTKEEWALGLLQSPDPDVACLAITNIHTFCPDVERTNEVFLAVAQNAGAPVRARTRAIANIVGLGGGDALSGLVPLLDSQDPVRPETPSFSDDSSHPFHDHPLLQPCNRSDMWRIDPDEQAEETPLANQTIGDVVLAQLRRLTGQSFDKNPEEWAAYLKNPAPPESALEHAEEFAMSVMYDQYYQWSWM